MTKHRRLLPLVVLAGCSVLGGKKAYTPAAYQGEVPLRIANHTGFEVCGFIMVAAGGTDLENWLGSSKLAPNGEAEFRIKPGAYDLVFTACDNVHTGVIKGAELSQATLVSFGNASPAAPTGFAVVAVPEGTTQQQYEACVSGACDPNGTACCAGETCGPDPHISGAFYCNPDT